MLKELNNKGFSLVEGIIMVAVLSTVMVMAFPNFIEFFKLQEDVQEERTMQEIKTALQLYAKNQKTLPDDDVWVESLAPYTSLSPEAILVDTWGQDRYYHKVTVANKEYRATSDLSVDYAVVYGYGPDRYYADTGAANAMNWANFFVTADVPGDPQDYANLKPAADDIMIKVTNYSEQVDNYEITEKRLQDISEALSNYSTSYFNNAQLAGAASSSIFNYYPPSDVEDTSVPDQSDYYNVVESATAAALNGTGRVRISVRDSTSGDKEDRKNDMEALMRILGLPITHCCSALVYDDDVAGEPAFFYYSNPRPITSISGATVTCGARPGLSDPKLPPRLSVDIDECG